MAPPTLVPDKNTLQRWKEEGLTHEQMVERLYETTGNRVTRTAISAAMQRYGLAAEGVRYNDTIPWRTKVIHAKSYQPRMLRLLGRRRQNVIMSDLENSSLDAWLETLAENKAIVAYDGSTDQGYFYISEKFKDHKEDIPIRIKMIHMKE